jgi:hypothetical protein
MCRKQQPSSPGRQVSALNEKAAASKVPSRPLLGEPAAGREVGSLDVARRAC